MKKIFALFVILILMIAGSVWADTCPNEKPWCDQDISNVGDFTLTGDFSVTGDATFNSNDAGGADGIGTTFNMDVDAGGETIQIHSTMDDVGASETGSAKNMRAKVTLGGDGTKSKFTSNGNTILIRPSSGQTFTMTTALYGVTVRAAASSNGGAAGTFAVPEYAAFVAGGLSPAAGHTINITDLYQMWILDWATVYTGAIPGTITNSYGMWMDEQTSATNNFGIVLDGTGDGASIFSGENQEAKTYYSGTNYTIDVSGGGSDKGIALIGGSPSEFILGNTITQRFTKSAAALTITGGGVINVTNSNLRITANAGPGADNLDTLNGGTAGDFIILKCEDAADVITVRDNSASGSNIYLDGGAAKVLDDPKDRLVLIYDSDVSAWVQLSFSNNG